MSNLSARIAITGANSFVGKSLRKLLYKNKVNVLGISRKNFGKYSTETKVQSKNLQEHQLQSKLKNYDVLVHLIGIGRETPKSTFKEINVNLTKNVIKTCKNTGIKKIIYISGLGVSKNSTSSYFASKYKAEREIINSGLDYTIFRASYIIGKTDHLTKSLSKQMKKGTIIIPGSGKYRLQPIFVEDVAKIILEAILEKKFSNKILDLVGPRKISFEDFVKLFSKNMKVKFKKIKNINIKTFIKPLRILHITNFNERHNGRLFFNTGRRINNGFIRLGNSVLEFSDRDIQKHYKSYNDIKGSKALNDKLIKTCYNYKPDLIVLGHADLISPNILGNLKDEYTNLKVAQWFLDPLNKNGPDFLKNKKRILDKSTFLDANFITTSPDVLKFLSKKVKNFFIPNPADQSFETLNNFNHDCSNDVFFALSHGVHRGNLKMRTNDDREKFLKKLIQISKNIKFDTFGINNIQPIWADQYFKTISNSKMGLNLSRGSPIKYYSSDRITQITGNGLVTLIDEKTGYRDFFNDKEMVFYKNISDLSEKILKISKDDKLRRSIAKRGKDKYLKFFNSDIVAEFIINKTFDFNKNKKYLWHNN